MKKTRLLPMLLFFCSFISEAQWISKGGPEGGGVSSVVATSSTVFAGIYSAGIYRSTDGGLTWSPSNTEYKNLSIRRLHASGSTVFAGTSGQQKVIRSTDEGVTWQPAQNGLSIYTVINCFTENASGVWLGSYEGVFLSTDNGDTWIDKSSDIGQKYVMNMTTSGDNILAGTTEGLFISSNNGDSWTHIEIAGPTDGGVYAVNAVDDKVFISISDGVYVSTDDGETWEESGNGIVDTSPAQFVKIGDKIFAPGAMSTYVSSNGGEDWELTGINGILVESMIYFNDRFIAGSYPNGIMTSIDGTAWTFSNTGLNGNTTEDLIKVDDNMFVATSITGVFEKTVDGEWAFSDNGSYAPLTLAAKGDSIYEGHNNGLRLSKNKGDTWENAGLTGKYILDIWFGEDEIVIMSDDEIFISTNDGETWPNKTAGLPNTQFHNVAVKGDSILVGTFNKGVYFSTNHGDTWTEMNDGFSKERDYYIFDLIVNNNDIYAATDGKVFVLKNNTTTWNNMTGESVLSGNALAVSSPHLFLGTDNGVFVAGLNSNKWNDISYELAGTQSTKLLTTSEKIIVGTNGRGVLEMSKALPTIVTPDHGVIDATVTITGGLFGTDTPENQVEFNGTPAIISSAEVTKLRVKVPEGATSGPITIKVGDVTIDAGQFTVEEPLVTGVDDINETEFLISPNPFRDAIKINTPGVVHLRLMDTMGKTIIQSQVSERLELTGLSPGLYFATVTYNGHSQTVKLLKVE